MALKIATTYNSAFDGKSIIVKPGRRNGPPIDTSVESDNSLKMFRPYFLRVSVVEDIRCDVDASKSLHFVDISKCFVSSGTETNRKQRQINNFRNNFQGSNVYLCN